MVNEKNSYWNRSTEKMLKYHWWLNYHKYLTKIALLDSRFNKHDNKYTALKMQIALYCLDITDNGLYDPGLLQ